MNIYWLLYYISKNPCINCFFGNIRGGKTALMFRIVELVHELNPDLPVFLYGFPFSAKKYLPSWFHYLPSLGDLPCDCILIRDDTSLSDDTHAKRSTSKEAVEFSRFLALAGQKRVRLFVTIQNTAIINKDIFRFGRTNLFFKYYDVTSRVFERDEFTHLVIPIMELFDKLISEGYDDLKLCYVMSSVYEGFFQNSLPSFWSQDLSEAFKNQKVGEVKKKNEGSKTLHSDPSLYGKYPRFARGAI